MAKKQTPVQLVIGTLYDESMKATGHSWTRLNGVLRSAMSDLIRAGVKFDVDDVADAVNHFGGRYWSSSAEDWYSSACDGVGNTSAALSLEKYFGRSPFIWAERTKTPTRLCVGSDLTWRGEKVTVTSFDDARRTLTACSYTNDRSSANYAFAAYRVIEARTDYDDGSIAVRYSASVDHERKVKRRFIIGIDELASVRAAYDARRRKHEKAIQAATTLAELDAAAEAATAEGAAAYRHFDLEILNAAVAEMREEIANDFPKRAAKLLKEKRKEELAEWERGRPDRERIQREYEERRKANAAADIAKWLAGDDDVRPYFAGVNVLRIKGEFVECSNGNKVSLKAAAETLPLVRRYRKKGWESNGKTHDVDVYPLKRIDREGVTIGCTLISWAEVDRFTPILKKACV